MNSGNYSLEGNQISDFIKWYNLLNEHLIRRLSQRIGLSIAKPVWRWENVHFSIKIFVPFMFFTDKLLHTKTSSRLSNISASPWSSLSGFSSTEHWITSTTANSFAQIRFRKNISFRQNTFSNASSYSRTMLRCNWSNGIQNLPITLWTQFTKENILQTGILLCMIRWPTAVVKRMPRIWSSWKKWFCRVLLSFRQSLEMT